MEKRAPSYEIRGRSLNNMSTCALEIHLDDVVHVSLAHHCLWRPPAPVPEKTSDTPESKQTTPGMTGRCGAASRLMMEVSVIEPAAVETTM